MYEVKQLRDRLYGTASIVSNNVLTGFNHLRDSRLNKSLAFRPAERQALGIHGLLPPSVKTQDEQLEQCMIMIERERDDLGRFMYLMDLMDRNEKLFYRFVFEFVENLLPIMYIPTIGIACQNYSHIFRTPRGLYISIYDKGHVYDIIRNWPHRFVRAIVVTDGEAILGLGDLGAQGMGIPISKVAMNTVLAGIKPEHCLPVMIDVGTNNQLLLDDKLYIGIRKNRVTGQEYDELIDEFVEAVEKRFGHNTLIQFEDFKTANSLRLNDKFKNQYCLFNSDVKGSAAVVMAGILAVIKFHPILDKNQLAHHKILLVGAGLTALGVAEICVTAMKEEGLSEKEAKKQLFLMDRMGLITTDRVDLTPEKVAYAQDHKPITNLNDAVKEIKPSILIGAAGAGRLFTKKMLKDMAKFNKRPIIFALSNPTEKSECTAEEAYTYTDGKAVFASGSPFPPVKYKRKTFIPRQANNFYIYPGITLGVTSTKICTVSNEMIFGSAKILASLVTKDDIEVGSIYPPLRKIQDISLEIAVGISGYAYALGKARHPKPDNLRGFISNQRFNHAYRPSVELFPLNGHK